MLVVEDQRALAEALDIAIDSQPDLDCLGAAGSVEEAVRLVEAEQPDVVLMDIHLPDIDGIEGTRRIKASRPETRVVILTGDATPAFLAAAAVAGAAGFLAKDSALADVLAAIRAPIGGKMLVESATLAALFDHLGTDAPPAATCEANLAGLTRRELEVLALMGEALDPKGIAQRLIISEHTARGHVKNVLAKLGVHSQLEAVVQATRIGLLPALPPAR